MSSSSVGRGSVAPSRGGSPPRDGGQRLASNDHYAMVADLLTQAEPLERRDLLRMQPEDDATKRLAKAEAMLAVLDRRSASLLAGLDAADMQTRAVLRALREDDGDSLRECGFDVEYAWLDDVAAALLNGAPLVTFETVGPYAVHHVVDDDLSVEIEKLPPDEKTGLLLGGLLREVTEGCLNTQTVTLLDDINLPGGVLPPAQGDRFVVEMAEIFREFGIIRSGDQPGREHRMFRESTLVDEVDELIRRLDASGVGSVEMTLNGDEVFRPTQRFIEKLALDSSNRRREFRRSGIILRRQGAPTCHALDACTYLSTSMRECMHLVVLERRFISEQEKTYALVRAIGHTEQGNYHSIFFDSDRMSPELVEYTLCQLLASSLRRVCGVIERMNGWDAFDPDEYVERNYGSGILTEDRNIMRFMIAELERSDLVPGDARLVADVGSGPNFYPSMLLTPYLDEQGAIDLIELGAANRGYAEATIAHLRDTDEAGIWAEFENLMVGMGGERYGGAFRDVCERANVVAGSVFALPRDRYDLVSAYFLGDSITTSRREFWRVTSALARSLRPNGTLIAAHMIGSREYHAGIGTHFPSVWLTIEDVEEAYRDADLTFTISLVDDASDKARAGYQGMAAVVARRND